MRAFEAAERHRNFKRAADELSLTPSAISHQVKALEEHLGVRLFYRRDGKLLLTEIGQAYVPGLRKAFDALESATSRVIEHGLHGALTLSLFPTLAAQWFIPRLGTFHRAHPGLDVRLISSITEVDFSSTDIDLAIRHGQGDWPGLRCDFMMGEVIFPVCSPEYLAASGPIDDPTELAHHTLIHFTFEADEWRAWLAAAGVEGVDLQHGLNFDWRMLALRAAMDGLGVAIGRRPCIDDDLAAGRLVAPFAPVLACDGSYYLVCRETAASLPKVVAFRQWLLAECRKSRAAA